MRRRTKILAGVAVVVVVGAFVLHYEQRRSALRATCAWARVLPLPASARAVEIEVTGSMFTRGFVVDFDAAPAEIAAWLAASPGTAGVTPRANGTRRVYDITPGGGAVFAKVVVDFGRGHVKIHVYWS